MTPPVRVGVMGCAEIARRRMLPAMAAADDIEVVAVASRDGRKAAELARTYGCRPVTGYDRLLAHPEVEAVYIPLPLAMHAQWVEAALSAGRHVLVEKPMSVDPQEVRRLFALAAARGLALMENVMFVHHRLHETVRRLLEDGEIGELRAMHAEFSIPRLPDHDIRYQPELGGGALWDVGLYPVRAAMHFLGGDLRVVGSVLTVGRGRGVDTAGAVLLSRKDGVTAQVAFGIEHAYASRYRLVGSAGQIGVERAFTPPADHAPVIGVETASGRRELLLAPDDQVANTLRAFTAGVRAGSVPEALTDSCVRQADLLDQVRNGAS
uniref:Putative 3-ketoreductase n=1 Tax=Streptomyces antibioticus TaxID=1890 RepID=G9VYV0_STRAT|nr:putative 3-ketoreductase [Streptomyces antibioticus]